jgi:hypothetical protein
MLLYLGAGDFRPYAGTLTACTVEPEDGRDEHGPRDLSHGP